MLELFHQSSFLCSRKVTELYSTSFTLGIKALNKKHQNAIFGIYGFVRFADEIVDTFHDFDKAELLGRYKLETFRAIEEKISLNPILHAFQITVHKYNIDLSLIQAFLQSMEMDLHYKNYKQDHYTAYIYGSAEVVGLMCLKVFCNGNETQYDTLKEAAKFLGSGFQKVNFLRDMQSDFRERGRVYFPHINFENFSKEEKMHIESEIESDFKAAYEGIILLPKDARFGVYLAYKYYLKLFQKIKQTEVEGIMEARIRVSNSHKFSLWISHYFRSQLFGIYAP